MAQPQSPRTKKSLDVLQSMINGILIEMGKALQAADKEAGRSMGAANMRLKTTIPSAVEAFHAALDELECDIVRAKAVLGRDLEQLRAQRYAAENPATEVPEETLKLDPLPEPTESFQAPIAVMAPSQPSPGPVIKEEVAPVKSPQAQEPSNHPTPSDPPKETILAMREDKKGPEVPSPQPANETKHNMIGLGIDTSGAANSEIAAPSTGENQDSAIDSLFGDMTESNDNTSNDQSTNLKFDDMDFFIHDSNSNTQNQEQPQAENQEFDLSTFGDPVHGNDGNLDFSMTDLQPSNEVNTGDDNASNEVANKQDDLTDIFGGLDDNAGGADFDDMFFGTGDDGGMSGGGIGGIEHGEFDDAFFGLDK